MSDLNLEVEMRGTAYYANGVAMATGGATASETLQNKTVNLTANTLTGTMAQFDTACSNGNFAYQAAAVAGTVVSGTTSIGLATGAGGTVTQGTSKATGVTLDKACGAITTHGAELAANTAVGFTLTNSTIAATDVVIVNIKSGGTVASYNVTVDTVAAGSCKIAIRNHTAGALSETLVLNFAVIKAVAA